MQTITSLSFIPSAGVVRLLDLYSPLYLEIQLDRVQVQGLPATQL